MALSQEEAMEIEKEQRQKVRSDLLAKYELTEDDVKEVTSDSGYALSVIHYEDDVEQTVLWQKLDTSEPYIIKVGFDIEVKTENVKLPTKKGKAIKD